MNILTRKPNYKYEALKSNETENESSNGAKLKEFTKAHSSIILDKSSKINNKKKRCRSFSEAYSETLSSSESGQLIKTPKKTAMLKKGSKNNLQVLNPLYNIKSYVNVNQNNNTSNLGREASNNSFVNVLTRTIRKLLNKKNLKNSASETTTPSSSNQTWEEQGNVLIDAVNMKENDMVQFKLRLPVLSFNQQDLTNLRAKYGNCANKISSDSYSGSSDSEIYRPKNIKDQNNNANTSAKCHQLANDTKFMANRFDYKGNRRFSYRKHSNDSKYSPSSINLNSNLHDFSLNSLSAFNLLNEQNIQRNKGIRCLILFILITILINPIFGTLALLAALKSKKSRDPGESLRLKTTARQTSLVGFFLSLFCIILAIVLFFLHHKFLFVIQNEQVTPIYNATATTPIALNTTQTTQRLKHKLHYEITDSVAPETTTTARKFDRLSILIEHGLFETLKKKFKLFNETHF